MERLSLRRLDNVTFKQLRALLAVERQGSITGAAAALNLTPPAVHSQIKGLEDSLDALVLTRSVDSTGSRLTAEGRIVLEAALRVEVALGQVDRQIAAMRRGQSGSVTLGVVSTAKYFAPGLVKTLMTLCPDVEIVLRVGNRDTVIEGLERHSLDLAIMGRPPRQPLVEAHPIGAHPHGLLAAPDHRLAGQAALSAADLADETFLSREHGSGTRILMTRYLDRLGEGQVFRTIEMESNETIKQAVMAGLGIAFLSLHTATAELKRGEIVMLDAPQLPIRRHWFVVRPAEMVARPACDSIVGAIRGLRGSFLPALRLAGARR